MISLPQVRLIQSPAELEPLVQDLLKLRTAKTIWLLEGEVGSGKTETAKTLARVFGLREVASPSFALHHRYESAGNPNAFDHLDLYRLEDEDDLESTGFWDLFSEPEGLILIEWADRLNPKYLPPDWAKFRVRFERGEAPTERRISISAG